MKKSIILLLTFALTSSVFAQKRTKGDWILLKEPRTNMMGKQVSKLIKKTDNTYEINLFDGVNQLTDKDYFTRDGVNERTDVEKYYRSIYTKYFDSEKNLDLKITAKNVKIYDLNMSGFDRVGYNKKVIVSGVGADTITVSVSFKKESNTDVAKITNDVVSKLKTAYGDLPSEITDIVKIDTFSIAKKDSVVFNYKLYNNKILYKVKIAKAKLVNSRMRTDYGKLFWAKDPNEVYLNAKNPTSILKPYAEWWGKGSNVGGRTWLSYDSDNEILYGHYEGIKRELPKSGKNYWDGLYFITTEEKGRKSKMIIISVYAVQEENGIKFEQYRGGRLATFLHYPEFKYKWY